MYDYGKYRLYEIYRKIYMYGLGYNQPNFVSILFAFSLCECGHRLLTALIILPLLEPPRKPFFPHDPAQSPARYMYWMIPIRLEKFYISQSQCPLVHWNIQRLGIYMQAWVQSILKAFNLKKSKSVKCKGYFKTKYRTLGLIFNVFRLLSSGQHISFLEGLEVF